MLVTIEDVLCRRRKTAAALVNLLCRARPHIDYASPTLEQTILKLLCIGVKLCPTRVSASVVLRPCFSHIILPCGFDRRRNLLLFNSIHHLSVSQNRLFSAAGAAGSPAPGRTAPAAAPGRIGRKFKLCQRAGVDVHAQLTQAGEIAVLRLQEGQIIPAIIIRRIIGGVDPKPIQAAVIPILRAELRKSKLPLYLCRNVASVPAQTFISTVVAHFRPQNRLVQRIGTPLVLRRQLIQELPVAEIAVGVVLVELVKVFVVVALFRPLDNPKVAQIHVVVVQILVVGQLVEVGNLVGQLCRVVVGRLVGGGVGIGGGDSAGGGRRRAQGVRRGPLALPGILLAVVLVEGVGGRVVGEVRPIQKPRDQILYGVVIAAFIGGGRLILEVPGRHGVKDKAAAIPAPGVSTPGAAQGVRLPVGRSPRFVGGGVPVVLLGFQDGHAEIRVLLGHREVGLGELAPKPAVLRRLPELVIGISAFCHRVLLSYCRPGLLLSSLPE